MKVIWQCNNIVYDKYWYIDLYNTSTCVFICSSYSKKHVQVYGYPWGLEPAFRQQAKYQHKILVTGELHCTMNELTQVTM